MGVEKIATGWRACRCRFVWCREPESNWRHRDFQSRALPTELSRHAAALYPGGGWVSSSRPACAVRQVTFGRALSLIFPTAADDHGRARDRVDRDWLGDGRLRRLVGHRMRRMRCRGPTDVPPRLSLRPVPGGDDAPGLGRGRGIDPPHLRGRLGKQFGNRMEILGGLILLAIGFRVLWSHLS